MSKYELLFIIDNSLTDEKKEALIKKATDLIEKNGGSDVSVDKWGTKKYAYPINYKTEGYYVLVNFAAPVNTPKTVANVLNITDGIVRQMIVAK